LQDFDSDVMHRLHHSEEYLPKKIIIKNYVPKCGHILPATLPDCKIWKLRYKSLLFANLMCHSN